MDILLQLVAAKPRLEEIQVDTVFVDAARRILEDRSLDPAWVALALAPIGDGYLAQQFDQVDVEAVYNACRGFVVSLGRSLRDLMFERMQEAAGQTSQWSLDGKSIGLRLLHNVLLSYLMPSADEQVLEYCRARYYQANNMTDRLACLRQLLNEGGDVGQLAIADFAERYQDSPLVMDKWFAIQLSLIHI